jgi:hypothetical protein
VYGNSFYDLDQNIFQPRSNSTLVRRRRWIRRIKHIPPVPIPPTPPVVVDLEPEPTINTAVASSPSRPAVAEKVESQSPPSKKSFFQSFFRSSSTTLKSPVKPTSNTTANITTNTNTDTSTGTNAANTTSVPLATSATTAATTASNVTMSAPNVHATTTIPATASDLPTELSKQSSNISNSSIAPGEIPELDNDMLDCDFEYEEDSVKDTDSVCSDISYTTTSSSFSTFSSNSPIGNTTVGGSSSSSSTAAPKKRNSFFSVFSSSSSSSSSTSSSTSTTTEASSTSSSASKPPDTSLKLSGNSTLVAIGKQIKFLEAESKKAEDARKKIWKDTEKPKLEQEISQLEKKLTALKQQLEKEAHKGLEHINVIDEEIRQILEKLDVLKQKLYFPFSPIRLGQGGVYLALTDFWLETTSGSFSIDINNDSNIPVIKLVLVGTYDNPSAGVIARLKVEGFKLAGDRGSGVPKLAFDSISITIAFSVSVRLYYDLKKQKWMLPKTDFSLKIISFKGPYGLNRR